MPEFLETLWNDIRIAMRQLARTPAFTFTSLFTIALAIGATTAVFSAVDRVLFRPLPFADESTLVSFGMTAPLDANEFVLGADYQEWRAEQTPFATTATIGIGGWDCDLTEGTPMRASCAPVESSLLPLLGVTPLLGRNFSKEEDRPGAPKVALLSHALWQSRFGGDPAILTKTIPIDGVPVVVIGVLPPHFDLPVGRADLLLPQQLPPQPRPQTGRMLRAFARLKPGVTPDQATAALQPLFARSLQFVPPAFRKEVKLRVQSLRDRRTKDARLASEVLLAAVLAVLLIACANVANLLLARNASRQREIAVRLALGATRARLARACVTESLLLAGAGGILGLAIATALLRVFRTWAPTAVPQLMQASLDVRVLSFTFLTAVTAGLLFGLAPAFQLPTVTQGARIVGNRGNWFRQALVAAQIGISLVLLIGAGLLLRTLWNLESIALGIETQRIATASVTLGQQRYDTAAKQLDFANRLENACPAVECAISDSLPPAGQARSMLFAAIEVEGRPSYNSGTGGTVTWRTISPSYFRVLGIPIRKGRGFVEEDRRPGANSIILSESLAARLFPAQNALGQRIQPGRSGSWWTVIGVAANVKNNGLAGADEPEYYIPILERDGAAGRSWALIARAPGLLLRQAVSSVDPALPVKIETMNDRVSALAEKPRFQALLLSLFALTGMLLGAIGLFGVVSFLTAERTQEIGVRVALGATPRHVSSLVLGFAMRSVIVGASLGLAGAAMAGRAIQSLLFGVAPWDPGAVSAAIAVLLLSALCAAWFPARAALRLDPAVALRRD
jgi:predicted permease